MLTFLHQNIEFEVFMKIYICSVFNPQNAMEKCVHRGDDDHRNKTQRILQKIYY